MGKAVKEKEAKKERSVAGYGSNPQRRPGAVNIVNVHLIRFNPEDTEVDRVMRYVGLKLAIVDAAKEFSDHISVSTPEQVKDGVVCDVTSTRTGETFPVRVPSIPGANTEDLERYARDTIRLTASFIRIRAKAD